MDDDALERGRRGLAEHSAYRRLDADEIYFEALAGIDKVRYV